MRKLVIMMSLTLFNAVVVSQGLASENTPPEVPKNPSPLTPAKPKQASPAQVPDDVALKNMQKRSAQKNKELNTDAATSGDPRAKGDR